MLTKEPTEVLDYSIEWTDWLNGLTISTSTWSVPSGITEDTSSISGTRTLIRLSGGTWAATYEITNTIVASNGETETRSFKVKIQRSVSYCSTSEFRRRATQATVATLPSAELEDLIEQASRMFDLECGVPPGYFNPPLYPTATTRTFHGDGTHYLKLDPYVTGSLDSSISLPDGYSTPYFVERDGYLVQAASSTNASMPVFAPSVFTTGWYRGTPVTVSAIWGFDETPPEVKMAVIELAMNLWRETDPASLKLVSIDNQPLRESLPPRVKEIARKYRVKGFALA